MLNTQINRLQELADHAKRNGHNVSCRTNARGVTFKYGAIYKRILTHDQHMQVSAIRRIDECCEILESIAFKPAPSAQQK